MAQMQDLAKKYMQNAHVKKSIKALMERGSRLNVNIDEVRNFSPELSNFILRKPIEAIKMFEEELNSQINTERVDK